MVVIKVCHFCLQVIDCPIKVTCTILKELKPIVNLVKVLWDNIPLVSAAKIVEYDHYQVPVHIFTFCCDLLKKLLSSFEVFKSEFIVVAIRILSIWGSWLGILSLE